MITNTILGLYVQWHESFNHLSYCVFYICCIDICIQQFYMKIVARIFCSFMEGYLTKRVVQNWFLVGVYNITDWMGRFSLPCTRSSEGCNERRPFVPTIFLLRWHFKSGLFAVVVYDLPSSGQVIFLMSYSKLTVYLVSIWIGIDKSFQFCYKEGFTFIFVV